VRVDHDRRDRMQRNIDLVPRMLPFTRPDKRDTAPLRLDRSNG